MSDQAALRSIDAPADDWNGGSYAAAAAVMALMGAFFWAIRGTTGFGGETGGTLAGFGWWKHWEMTTGLVGGLAFGIAFWLFNRPAAEGAAPLGSIARAFFRSGLHLSIPSFILLDGAYEGVCNVRGVEPTATARLLLFAVCVGFPLIIRPRRSDGDSGAGARCGVSLGTSAALLGMIVVAGYLVSIPAEWQLATAALVVLYTGYVGASILLTSKLWRRERP